MPTYHFHTEDGGPHPDREGTELPDDESARIQAARLLGELLKEQPETFWKDQRLSLTVADHRQLTLFVLEVTATASPLAHVDGPRR